MKEWAGATNFSGLPDHVGGAMADKWIQGSKGHPAAVQHVGALTQAARAADKSKALRPRKNRTPVIRAFVVGVAWVCVSCVAVISTNK